MTKSLQDLPVQLPGSGSTRRVRRHRSAVEAVWMDGIDEASRETGTALGAGERGAAGGRKRGNARGELRFDLRDGLNGTTHLQRDGRYIGDGQSAARQVLEHLTLEAIVISWMRRTAGNLGRIALVRRRGRSRQGVPELVCYGLLRGEVHPDPRQQTERRPGERNHHAAGDPRTPARAPR